MLESAISSGYVHTRKKTPPEGLKHDFLCLDRSCFEKIATISREGKVIDSRIRNSLFFTRDFFVPPSELEKQQFGIVDVFASGTAQ
jgi:hypothetical protein